MPVSLSISTRPSAKPPHFIITLAHSHQYTMPEDMPVYLFWHVLSVDFDQSVI